MEWQLADRVIIISEHYAHYKRDLFVDGYLVKIVRPSTFPHNIRGLTATCIIMDESTNLSEIAPYCWPILIHNRSPRDSLIVLKTGELSKPSMWSNLRRSFEQERKIISSLVQMGYLSVYDYHFSRVVDEIGA